MKQILISKMHCKLLFKNKALWVQGKNLIIKIIVVILNWCSICYPYYVKGHFNTSLIGPALVFRWTRFTIVVVISLCLRLLRRWYIHTCTLTCMCRLWQRGSNTQNFFSFHYLSFPNSSNKIYMSNNVSLSRYPSKWHWNAQYHFWGRSDLIRTFLGHCEVLERSKGH